MTPVRQLNVIHSVRTKNFQTLLLSAETEKAFDRLEISETHRKHIGLGAAISLTR